MNSMDRDELLQEAQNLFKKGALKEAEPLVNRMIEKGLLGYGAGHLVLTLAQRQGLTVREAGQAFLNGKYWEALPI